MKGKQSKTAQRKPQRIVFLSWIFLLATLADAGLILALFPAFGSSGYDSYAMIEVASFILPAFLLAGITWALFSYTKASMKFVMPFAIGCMLLALYWLQYFYMGAYFKFFGMSLDDIGKLHPSFLKYTQTHYNEVAVQLSSFSLGFALLFYGIPVLLLYILHKLAKKQ